MAKNVQQVGSDILTEDARVGLSRQITIDTSSNEVRVHDGVTPGGHRLPNVAGVNTLIGEATGGATGSLHVFSTLLEMKAQLPSLNLVAAVVESTEELIYCWHAGAASASGDVASDHTGYWKPMANLHTEITDFAKTLLDDSDASIVLTTLGVTPFVKMILDDEDGEEVRVTIGAGDMLASNNLDDVDDAGDSLTNLGVSDFVKTLLDDADADASRTTLAAFGKIQSTVFTASGTYTKAEDLLYITVELVGGGGGGGAGDSLAAGSGGSSAGRSSKTILATDLAASESITIGDGGTGGVAGSGGNGTAGGTTSFGSHLSAIGGGHGRYASYADAPGQGVGGHLNTSGSYGQNTGVFADVIGGLGADSFFGGGGVNGGKNGGSGGNGLAPGAGGGGAISYSGGSYNGGAGATGIVIITEFLSK